MMSGLAVKISADQTITFLPVTEVDLAFLQKEVGGYITPISMSFIPRPAVDINAWCDEDGLMKGLPVNELASVLLRTTLVGDVVFTKRNGEWDDPLTRAEVNTILEWVISTPDLTLVEEE